MSVILCVGVGESPPESRGGGVEFGLFFFMVIRFASFLRAWGVSASCNRFLFDGSSLQILFSFSYRDPLCCNFLPR